MHIIEDEFFIQRPLQKVFAFFSNPRNLNVMTPKFNTFTIQNKEPIVMKLYTIIDYKIKFRGVPMKWRSKFTIWDPPYQFQDIQTIGPFVFWEHTHTFTEKNEGTIVRDRVRYKAIGWIFEGIINKLFVQRDVKKILAYKREHLNHLIELIDAEDN